MDLTLDQPGNAYAVRSVSAAGIKIADTVYRGSLLLTADRIEHPWSISSANQLDADVAGELLAWEPEIVLVGTGSRLVFPDARFGAALMRAGVGFEAMDNPAACRTYNVLISEERKVLAALIQSPSRSRAQRANATVSP